MKTPRKGYDMSVGISTIPGILHLFRRVLRALIGRSRRFSICRKLMGNGPIGAILVGPLDASNVSAWERYLGLPAGRITLPVRDVYTHIALDTETVVGHVSVLKQWANTPVNVDGWWLTGLEVNPRRRCAGLGRRLVTSIISEWRENHDNDQLFLVVHKKNKPAILLFTSIGFRSLRNPEWERKLQKAYPDFARGRWNYSIMEYRCESSTHN